MEWLRIESLSALDALVGRYITSESPEIHWEESYAQMRFDSVEEGLEALREPYFQQFIPAEARSTTVLREVQQYAPYSTDLETAWKAIEKLGTPRQPFRIWRDWNYWCAVFGENVPVTARTAPIAICLAALRLRGLEIVLNCGDDAATGGA
jgi:hypothetical protein